MITSSLQTSTPGNDTVDGARLSIVMAINLNVWKLSEWSLLLGQKKKRKKETNKEVPRTKALGAGQVLAVSLSHKRGTPPKWAKTAAGQPLDFAC